MKTRMIKIAAWLIAVMMICQVVPVFAETFVSNVSAGSPRGYKEALEIINNDGTYLLSGHVIHLSVNADYTAEWSSSNESVATVSADGTVTAVSAGNVKITATSGDQTAEEYITVINPEQSYKITYQVTYPANALASRYGDKAATKPQDTAFTETTNPVTGSAASYVVNDGDFDCENYQMTGWVNEDGEFIPKGTEIKVSRDMTLTAKFEVIKDYIQTGLKFKARYVASGDGVTYFTNGVADKNAPAGYEGYTWKWLTSYGNEFAAEDGTLMLSFRMPDSTRDASSTNGYTVAGPGNPPRTLVGYRLLKILKYDGDISAYQTEVYKPNELVTLPMSGDLANGGYFFAPVFDDSQAGEAVVKIRMNGDTSVSADYVGQGRLTQAGIDALAAAPWGKASGILNKDNDEAHIYGGSDVLTPVSASYYDASSLPSVKDILNKYGMTAENPDNWTVVWYKVACMRSGYLIEGSLIRNETTVESAPKMVIVINGATVRKVFNGEEQTLADYNVISSDPAFNPAKVELIGEIGVSRRECGTAILELSAKDFKYNDPSVKASFVVSNGWLKITPAPVKVKARNLKKVEGEADPELTATVKGLYGDDQVTFELSREEGEEPGDYLITPTGEEKQGNYTVSFDNGRLSIKTRAEAGIPENYYYTVRYIVKGEYTRDGEDMDLLAPKYVEFDEEDDMHYKETAVSVEGYKPESNKLTGIIGSTNNEVVTFVYVPQTVTYTVDRFFGGEKLSSETVDGFFGQEIVLDTDLKGYVFLSCDQGDIHQTITLDSTYFSLQYSKPVRTVRITSSLEGVDEVYSGTQVTLTAVPEGFEDVDYTVQWSYETPDHEIHEIAGANELVYTYDINAENAGYIYHVVLTPAE